MPKKSIILLITILFISAISILILQNLKQSEEYLDVSNKEYSNTQVILLIKNAQNELLNLFAEDEVFEAYLESDILSQTIPLTLKGIDFNLNISLLNKEFNINDFALKDEKLKEIFINKVQEYFSLHQMDFYTFNEIINEYFIIYKISEKSPISSSKQVNNIINNFIKKTYLQDKKLIKNVFGFLAKTYKNSDNKSISDYKLLVCKLTFVINNHKYLSSFILDPKKKINNTGVLDFEFTFK